MWRTGILLLCFLVVLLSCRKESGGPGTEKEIISPPPPVQTTVVPWDTLDIAPYTPVAIKKEIFNWQQNFCEFARVEEFQYSERTVYRFETGCSLESGSYLFDTSAVILCVLKGPEDQCLGNSFAQAGFPRLIWSNFEIRKAEIESIKWTNSQIAVGERSFAQIKFKAGYHPKCAYQRHELIKEGDTGILSVFYKTPLKPAGESVQRKELNINLEFRPTAPGTYIFRSDSTALIADTLIVN